MTKYWDIPRKNETLYNLQFTYEAYRLLVEPLGSSGIVCEYLKQEYK